MSMWVELPGPWIVALNVIAWLLIQVGFAWGLTRVGAARFNAGNGLAQPRRWERGGRVYERLFAVKSWKDKLPDAAAWFPGGFAKGCLRRRSPDFLRRFYHETWRGELAHWLPLLTLPVFCIWNPPWALLVNITYAVAANLPCILVQRYNRARLWRLLERL